MCGIVGIVGERNPELIRTLTNVIRHRGPDGQGFFEDDHVSLGHARLAIVDLEHGDQPMRSDDGRFVLIFNGEVYNHLDLRPELERAGAVFRTHCDTETILRGYEVWGAKVVERLRGMFAFAVWDTREHSVFLARDHMGIKPLYYAQHDGRLIFASELKAIVADPRFPRQPDLAAIDAFMTGLMFPADLTAFEGVRQLEAGHTLTCKAGGQPTIERYYEIGFPRRYERMAFEDAVDLALERTRETVELRQMSDVPVGVFLSGGVDSSLVAALLAEKQDAPVRTFSLVHKGEHAWLDESEYIDTVVKHIGADHTEVESDPDWYTQIPRVIQAFDQPCTTSINSYMLSQAAAEQVKVVLTGTGGDEAYAGYGRYELAMKHKLGEEVARSWIKRLLGRTQDADRERAAISGLRDAFARRNVYFHGESRRATLTDAAREAAGEGAWDAIFRRHFDRAGLPDGLSRCLHTDQMLYLINNLHNNMDKVSMAHGLEARVPLCDFRFIEAANTVPPGVKMQGGELKAVLKAAAARVLPRSVIYRQKRGFGIPLKTWVHGPFGERIVQVLRPDAVERRGLFRPDEVARLVERTRSGQADHSMKLWILMTVELWHRMYIDSNAFLGDPSFEDLVG
ncbi:MAG: asparagine synthase (glutamine-hydrolyzing) [Phycisphaerales bacterium]